MADKNERELILEGYDPVTGEVIPSEWLQSAYMGLFAPRQKQAYLEGRDPSLKDYAGDALETVISFTPIGPIGTTGAKALGVVSRKFPGIVSGISKTPKFVKGLIEPAFEPLATNIYDAAAYDNNTAADAAAGVAAGTAINAALPALAKRTKFGKRLLNDPVANNDRLLKESMELSSTPLEEVLRVTPYDDFDINNYKVPDIPLDMELGLVPRHFPIGTDDPMLNSRRKQKLGSYIKAQDVVELANLKANGFFDKAKKFSGKKYKDQEDYEGIIADYLAPDFGETGKLLLENNDANIVPLLEETGTLEIPGKVGEFLGQKYNPSYLLAHKKGGKSDIIPSPVNAKNNKNSNIGVRRLAESLDRNADKESFVPISNYSNGGAEALTDQLYQMSWDPELYDFMWHPNGYTPEEIIRLGVMKGLINDASDFINPYEEKE